MASKNYQNLYDLAKAVLAEEGARNARLDEKASRVLSGLTVVIAIYAFYGQWMLQHIPPDGVLEHLMLVFASFALLFLVIAWVFTFTVFKISRYAKLPFGDKVFDLHGKLDTDQFFFSLSRTINRSIKENREIGAKKVQALTNAFRMIFGTGILLLFLLISIVVHTWLTPRTSVAMTEVSNCSAATGAKND